ncbi:MAG: ABC transporter permease [Chlamydiae bacterium]|nr:ABC transporter permease [Chlamydiota bacterium]MBI3266846.1 ABC transporter permease [Chlamydiota bacterium]
MSLPLKYSYRNLMVRRVTTVMTILGMGLTVGIFICLMAFTEGIRSAMVSTGSPDNIVLMRDGSVATEFSVLDREILTELRAIPEAKTMPEGKSCVSAEYHIAIPVPMKNVQGQRKSTRTRGILPEAFWVYDKVRIIEGTQNVAGGGVLLGQAVAKRMGYHVGDKIKLGRGEWTVVGILGAGGTSYDSEMWMDLNELLADQKKETISCVTLKVKDPKQIQTLIKKLSDDTRLHVKALTEIGYYEEQSQALAQINILGNLVAILMAIAAVFGGMNTMYAAVAGRVQEIGTLRSLGFTKGNILVAILIESCIIAFFGALTGSLMGLIVNGISITTLSPMFWDITFQFRVTFSILLSAFGFAFVMGIVGGIFPARSASQVEMARALRQE